MRYPPTRRLALLALGIALLAAVPAARANPPLLPSPEDYPPGTVFSVVVAPDGRIAWAPSQDPERPAVTRTDGVRPPILPYDPAGFPPLPEGSFGVVRSGGHHTLAQILFYLAQPPEVQKQIREGTRLVGRTELRGYVAVTVTFERGRMSGQLLPYVVSWKSLQLNLNNVVAWGQPTPPIGEQVRVMTILTREVNGNNCVSLLSMVPR